MPDSIYRDIQAVMHEKKITAKMLVEKGVIPYEQKLYDIRRAKKVDMELLFRIAKGLEVPASKLTKSFSSEQDISQITNEDSLTYESSYKKKYLNALEEVSELKSYVIELQKKVITLTESK